MGRRQLRFSDLKRVAEMAGKYPAQRYVIINKADLNYEVSDQIEEWCIRQKIPMAGKHSMKLW